MTRLVACLLLLLVAACEAPGAPEPAGDSERMVRRLAELSLEAPGGAAEGSPWRINRPQTIEPLRRALADATNPVERTRLRLQLAQELLLDGRSAEALEQFRAIDIEALPFPPQQRPAIRAQLAGFVGIAALRMGEQQNCVAHHGPGSCIFPLDEGRHTAPEGARIAAAAFARRLEDEPRSLSARWLLNIAHMALGDYPDAVPRRWRLPPESFASPSDPGRFPNVSSDRGAAIVGLAGGCAMEDFDGDGDVDIVASSWGLDDPLRLLINDGRGNFEDRSEQAGLSGLTGGLNLNHADYDNDGDADIYVMRGGWLGERGRHPNSLLRNDGQGKFVDVTAAVGLWDEAPSQTAAWADYDRDGDLDLFVGNEQRGGAVDFRSRLYRNDDGQFFDVALASGIADAGFVKGATWGDYDDDGLPDLYLSRAGQPNLLLRNGGAGTGDGWRFEDTTAAAGVAEPITGFPTWFFDFDDDGRLDLFVGAWDGSPVDAVAAGYLGLPHGAAGARLYRNEGGGRFSDVSAASGVSSLLLAMGANFGDIDNDGRLDIYVGNGAPDFTTLMPNRMLHNVGGLRFDDVTEAGGFGHLQKGHGIAFGDVDGDGDQDVYAVMGGWFSGDVYANALFDNPGHGHRWLTLHLFRRDSRAYALGARVRVVLRGAEGQREIHRVVTTGGSFGSSTLALEIGLGRAQAIESLEIAWPDGSSGAFGAVPLDSVVEITQGSARLETID